MKINSIFLNDHLLIILISIIFILIWLIILISLYRNINFLVINNYSIENLLILLLMSFSSFYIFYLLDEDGFPDLNLEIKNNKWFYNSKNLFENYSSKNNFNFSSYLLVNEDIPMNNSNNYFLLFETSKRVFFPVNTNIKLNINPINVLYSWTIPLDNMKIDVYSNKLTSNNFFFKEISLISSQLPESYINFQKLYFINLPFSNSNNYFNFVNKTLCEKKIINEKASYCTNYIPSPYDCNPDEIMEVHRQVIKFFPERLKRPFIVNLHMTPWFREDLDTEKQMIVLEYERALLLNLWLHNRRDPRNVAGIVHKETWAFHPYTMLGSFQSLEFLKIRIKQLHKANFEMNEGSFELLWLAISSLIFGLCGGCVVFMSLSYVLECLIGSDTF